MKTLSLAFAVTFMLTTSLSAQDKDYDPIPKAIVGEWKALTPKNGNFESITFYASGLVNIDTKGSKKVMNYKVSKRPGGYEVFISGMEHTAPFSSFLIKSLTRYNMQITTRKEDAARTFTLVKARDIPFGNIPLQTKNQEQGTGVLNR